MFHPSSSASSSSSSHVCVGDPSPPVSCPAAAPAVYPTAAAPCGFLDANNASAFPHLLSSSPSYSYSYSSSLPNYFLRRSSSTHSLPFYHRRSNPLTRSSFFSPPQNSSLHLQQQQQPPQPQPQPPAALISSSPPSSSSGEFLEFNTGPMRRVFSTGDLQGSYGALAAGENHVRNQEGAGPMSSKVARYSSEERKERIERYRIKRNQRNFQKKITYACRKTLADSRPRVRGRFARNGEAETGSEVETTDAGENIHEYFYANSVDQAARSFGELADGNEYWYRHVPAAAEEEEDCLKEEEDIWATIRDVISMNLLS